MIRQKLVNLKDRKAKACPKESIARPIKIAQQLCWANMIGAIFS
jgi:hypothetical protein